MTTTTATINTTESDSEEAPLKLTLAYDKEIHEQVCITTHPHPILS